MRRKSHEQKTYYSVFAVRDGTIWHASTRRKPGGMPPSDIDADGVFNTFVGKLGEEDQYTPVAKVVRGGTLATCLNLKRVLRNQVERRLAAIAQQLIDLKAQADRIEAALLKFATTADGNPDASFDQPCLPDTRTP